MGIVQDVYNALKAFEITKIDGQPTDDDINKLTTQLTAALVTISTGNEGGKLGHIGIAVPETQHVVLSTALNSIDQSILVHTQQLQVMTKRFTRRKSQNTKRKSSNLKLTWPARHRPAKPP